MKTLFYLIKFGIIDMLDSREDDKEDRLYRRHLWWEKQKYNVGILVITLILGLIAMAAAWINSSKIN